MNHRPFLSFCFSLLLLASPAVAQDRMNLDSLLRLLPSAKEDTAKVLLYITIGNQYEDNEPEKAKQYYLSARDLSHKLHYTLGMVKFISNYTYVLNTQGYLDSALTLNLQSIELAKKLNSKERMASVYANTGASYQYLEQYDSAIKYYITAEKLAEENNNKEFSQTLNSNVGLIYKNMGQYDKAALHFKKGIDLARELNNPLRLARTLSNYSMVLLNTNKVEEAIKALTEALPLAKDNGDTYSYHAILLNLADAQVKLGHYGEIKRYVAEALPLARQLDDKESITLCTRAMGYYYFYHKSYDSARYFAQQSIDLSRDIKNKEDEHLGWQLLSDIALARQNFTAFLHYRSLSDSVANTAQMEKVSAKIQEYNVQYETEKKETQIQLQKASIRQKNTLNYILIGSAVFLLIVSVLVYFNYLQKQKLQRQRIAELETEKQLAATAAVLKGEEQERTRLARDLHDGLGGMLSGLKFSFASMKGNMVMTTENQAAFDRSMDMLDSSINEMRRVAHNMMPEALINSGLDTALKDFCHDINQSKVLHIHYQSIGLAEAVIPQTALITVYRIIQELINNTIKHAQATTMLVQVVRDEQLLSVTVEDDGKGFDIVSLKHVKGIGWNNIESRVNFLKGNMDVQSKPGEGTSVHIEFTL